MSIAHQEHHSMGKYLPKPLFFNYLRSIILLMLFWGGMWNSILSSQVSITNQDSLACCFQLNYNYDGLLGEIDQLETQIITPGVLFSSIQFPLNSGWNYTETLPKRRLRWSHNSGSIPLGEQMLADFCFSGWDTSEPVELLVIWRQNNSIRQRDTLQLTCSQCWKTEEPIVDCLPDSSYIYTFDYTNLSAFDVDYLQIREPDGQDIILEENIALVTSLTPGETMAGIQFHLTAEASNKDKVCFEITPKHFFIDSISRDCCTAEYCIPIPDCDRCCTDYLLFEEDVQQGFSMAINCDNRSVQIQANALNECDQVQYEISGLGAGGTSGNEAVTFGGLTEDNSYTICMTATRQDRNGENCYEEATLEFCDEFTFDCDQCINEAVIDFDINCPAIVDLVCGCDGMTYLNSCAASSWGGVTAWESGCCDQIGDIELMVQIDQLNHVLLDWTTTSTATLRYFIIQRRVLLGGPWLTIGQVANTTFSFNDTNSLNPVGEYRVIGVSLEGKVLMSEDCMMVAANTLTVLEQGEVWPSPASSIVYLTIPVQNHQQFEVFNSTGQCLGMFTTDHIGQAILEVDQWPAGYYFITASIQGVGFLRMSFVVVK